MHITSDIYYRFATTVVEAKILNVNNEASEVLFDVTLPDAAFITAFTIPRTSNKFNILVNIQKNALVVFKLKYQELLRRTLGSYHHVIYVDPGQPIEDFEIKVFISEFRDIVKLSVPPLEGKTEI
ncbi:Hypothetical predicted protein, partial [Mytilus galloprovincialis]